MKTTRNKDVANAASAGSDQKLAGQRTLQQRNEDLVQRNLAGIFRTTLDGQFLECNDAMANVLGYADRAVLMQHRASELYFEEPERQTYLTELKKNGRLMNTEVRLKHKDGHAVFVLASAYLDEDSEGSATVLGILMDVSSLKQAEYEQRALTAGYRALVERMHDGLFVVHDGVVRYANPAGARFVGSLVDGLPFAELFHMDDRVTIATALVDAQGGGRMVETRARLGSPGEREFMLTCTGTLHNGSAAVQVTLHDHSTQQRLIRERIQLQMAQEVNQVLREEIDQHRRTQEALRRSRRFARNLIDSSLDMIMAGDQEGRITEYNPAASIRFGYEADEVLGMDTLMLYADPEEFKRVQIELDRHGAFAGEVRNVDKFGNEFTSFLAASRLFDEGGRLVGAMGVSRDITRMKQDQEALRASEERYRDLFENATDLIQSLTPEGRFDYVNRAWRTTLGYSEQETRELSIWDVVHPDHAAALRSYFERLLRAEKPGEFRVVLSTRDGREITVEGDTTLRTQDGKPVALRSIFRDITNVVAARQRVEEHEAKLRALFESSEHMFWTVEPDLRITSFNKGYGDMIERLHGARPEVNLDPGSARKKFATEEYHSFWAAKYAEAFSGKALRFETDLLDNLGRRVCNEIFLSPVFDADGSVTEVFGVGHEITEQKLAEDLVREQAARLKAIFESSANMMIWTLDQDMRITSFNAHFQTSIEHIHGIRFEIGDHFSERMAARVAPERAKTLLLNYASALRGKPQQFEVELVDLWGRPAWVENFLNPIVVDGRVEEISCLAYGITDRKQAQRELEQSLGEKEVLLKEVHHRVKNNLQVISSIMKLQSERVDNDPRLLEVLHHSRDRVRSMALIHDSLYQNKQFSYIDLGNYIDGLARNLMMSYSLTGRIGLELDLRPVHISIDQAMPCGLILNELISNALKHGFPGERPGVVSVSLTDRGGQVCVRVSDNGVGLQHGFNEKRDGHLGLELVRMLVEQLDGHIERTPDKGLAYLLTFERNKIPAHGADERPRS